MKFLAMDFGGTFVKHCLMNESAEMSERGEYPAPLESTDLWVKTTAELYAKYKGQVDGIAISMPGVIDSESGIAHSGGAYGKAIQGKNIYELLRPYVDVPVAIENDAKAAVQAELWKGALQDVKTACVCIVGSGLGGGIVMNGKLQKGSHFAAGEISGLLTEAGNYSFPSMAATKAATSGLLIAVAQAKGMNPKDFEISGFMGGDDSDRPKIGGKEVLEWVEQGDEVTARVYQKWIENLVAVLFNMKMTLDPDKVVVGGGISRNPKFMKDLKAEWERASGLLDQFGMPRAELDVCHFTADANMVGAVYNWLLLYQK